MFNATYAMLSTAYIGLLRFYKEKPQQETTVQCNPHRLYFLNLCGCSHKNSKCLQLYTILNMVSQLATSLFFLQIFRHQFIKQVLYFQGPSSLGFLAEDPLISHLVQAIWCMRVSKSFPRSYLRSFIDCIQDNL